MNRIIETMKFRNELNESINEALGIRNEVWDETCIIEKEILDDLSDRYSIKFADGVFVKIGKIETTFLNKPLTVDYQYVNFVNQKAYSTYVNRIKLKKNFYNETLNLLTLHFISISGHIDETSLIDTIQHELHHDFQETESGIDFSKIPLYQKAIRLKGYEDDTVQYNIGDILYITFKHEIEAYANGLFAYLMKKYEEGYTDTTELVMGSDIYNMLQTLRKRKEMFLKYKNTPLSMQVMRWIGMTDNKFEERIKWAEREIISRMGKAIVAAKDKTMASDEFDGTNSRYTKESVDNLHIYLK